MLIKCMLATDYYTQARSYPTSIASSAGSYSVNQLAALFHQNYIFMDLL